MIVPELRQLRYVVAVAEHRSFTAASDALHVAQQGLSQQVKVVEQQLGVDLFSRTSRGVDLTPAGAVFVQEARKVIKAAERAVARTVAVSRGEAGSIRVAYTLTSVYDTLPELINRLAQTHPSLKVVLREVYGGDLERLLTNGEHDVAIAPRMALLSGLDRQELRRDPFLIAVSDEHPLAGRGQVALNELDGDAFELWPRELAPGYHDAVIAACRASGFEPRLDEHASGSTVWGNIAQNRGVALVVRSLTEQLPRGITLLDVVPAVPALTIDLIWHAETASPMVRHVRDAAAELMTDRAWLV